MLRREFVGLCRVWIRAPLATVLLHIEISARHVGAASRACPLKLHGIL